jgi:hypothetical protein
MNGNIMKTYPLTQLWEKMQSAKQKNKREEKMSEKIYAIRAGHQVVSQPGNFNLTRQHSSSVLAKKKEEEKCSKKERKRDNIATQRICFVACEKRNIFMII